MLYTKPIYELIKPGIVRIYSGYGEPFQMDRKSLQDAIKRVKSSRNVFVSYDSWRATLDMYKGALRFLESAS